jgi:glycosyltransferase involved in cell wall biosynthesis
VIETLDYGGAERLVHCLAVRMRGAAYRPIVCCLRRGPLAAALERDGVRVECLNLRRPSILTGPVFAIFLVRLLRGLGRVIDRHRVAIVHAHLPDSILSAAVAAALRGTPVVGTYHHPDVLPVGRPRYDLRNPMRRALYRVSERLTDRTIAVSSQVHERLRREFRFPPHKTVLLLNGVDTDAFARLADDERLRHELGLEGQRVVTCVARLVAHKGQHVLIDAMAEVVRSHPDTALVLVGVGPERPALVERARALGLADRVRFAGARSDVAAILGLTDVFVLPSFAEGLPLVLIEAMAAGRPVVATAVPGNLDVIGDDRYGILVPPGEARALSTAIGECLADPAHALERAARGRQRARDHFDLRRFVAGTETIYDSVLAERRPGEQGLAT